MSAIASAVFNETNTEVKLQEEEKQQAEFQRIIKNARASTDLLTQVALKEHDAWIKQTRAEIRVLMEIIYQHSSSLRNDVTKKEELKKNVMAKLTEDLELIEKLNETLKSYGATGAIKELQEVANKCSFPLKTNKMKEVITGAKELLEKHFDGLAILEDMFTILDEDRFVKPGVLPTGYNLYLQSESDITVFGPNDNNIYGNSKGTFLKTALLYICMAYTGKSKLSDLNLPKQENRSWIDGSAISHIITLPPALTLDTLKEIDPRFEKFGLFFSDETTPQGLVTVHSGFAFGGHRSELQRYPNGKPFGPEDCSSWLMRLTGCPHPVTNADLWFFYNAQFNPIFKETPEYKRWITGSEPRAIADTFEAVHPYQVLKDPANEIIEGMICVYINFDLNNDPSKTGTSKYTGHAAFTIGYKSGPAGTNQSKIVTLSYNRDMSEVEGFGLGESPAPSPDANNPTNVLIFSIKGRSAANMTLISEGSNTNIPSVQQIDRNQKTQFQLSTG